ncbi:hypothetical protein MUP77_04780 [Candidatus Bathyarchaeota archaeon]|nr:hypothetical protein [Candidatus Bathyarchaeota archaeon]
MKTLSEFEQVLLKDEYKFLRRTKKPFGIRAIAQKRMSLGRADKRILIYIHVRKTPTPKDFMNFLKDFEKFIKSNESSYDVKNGYLIVDKSCPKRTLQGFRTVLKTAAEEIRKKVKIVQVRP